MGTTMNILVTGGLGLIGHNVVRRLQSAGHTVTITDTRTNYGIVPQDELDHLMVERVKTIAEGTCIQKIDVADTVGMKWLFESKQFDTVIHLASFPRQKVVNANPMDGSRVMSEGLLNLLELSEKNNINKFVYISSSMVYGDFADDVKEDAVCVPQGQYGIMKLAGEWLTRDYTRKSKGKMSHTIIRPSAVYGPRDVEDRVVAKFITGAIQGKTLNVNGAGEHLDFTYVTDIADGIVAATLSDNTANKTYNITRSSGRSLEEAARLAVKIAGSGNIKINERDLAFPSRGALNIDAARRDFGYNPKVDINQGFYSYYQWLTNDSFFGYSPTV
jgi:nucleoside-diphosphate-sugar epimerase